MAEKLPLTLPPLVTPPINLTQLVQVPNISPVGEPDFPPLVEEKSPTQTYEVGKVYESKEWILMDKVQMIQDDKILITLDLPNLEDLEDVGSDLRYEIFKSLLIYPALISVFDSKYGGYVIWSDVITGKSKVLHQFNEDAQIIFISNGLIVEGGEAPTNFVYEIPSGEEYEIPENDEDVTVIGSDDTIVMMDTDAIVEFSGGNYDDAIERTGHIQDGHLLWIRNGRDYDFDLTKDQVTISEPRHPVHTMEQIYTQPQQWVDEILKLNNVDKASFQIDRLNAIILIHNAGMLTDEDIKYVTHPEFVKYASMTEQQLGEEIVKQNLKFGIQDPTRFDVIRALL